MKIEELYSVTLSLNEEEAEELDFKNMPDDLKELFLDGWYKERP